MNVLELRHMLTKAKPRLRVFMSDERGNMAEVKGGIIQQMWALGQADKGDEEIVVLSPVSMKEIGGVG